MLSRPLFAVLFLPALTARAQVVSVLPEPTDSGAIPAGTVLQIRLRQSLSSFGSKRDTPVSAIVIAPVEVDGQIVLPMYSELLGTLVDVRRVGLGFSRETAMLNLHFESITVPGGQPQGLVGQIAAVDDSREVVDAQGRIHGIRATASPSSTVSGFAESAAGIDPMLLLFGLSSSLSVFRIPEAEIIFPAGTELRFRLDQPLQVSGARTLIPPPIVHSEEDRTTLAELVRPLPFRTHNTDPGSTFAIGKLEKFGPLRHELASAGFGISF